MKPYRNLARKKRRGSRPRFLGISILPVFVCIVFFAPPGMVFAQTTWTAFAGTAQWGDAANWNTFSVPGSGDDVIIPSAPSGGPIFPSLVAVSSTDGTTANLTIQAGASVTVGWRTLTVNGNLGGGGALTVSSGTANVTGNLTVGTLTAGTGTVNLTGAAAATVNAYTFNNLAINKTGAVTIAGPSTVNGALTVTNSGGTTFSGALTAGTVTLSNTTGTIAFQGNTTMTTLNTANQGYNVSFTGGTNSFTNDVNFRNTGTVTLGNGGDILTFTGGLATAGNPSNPSGTSVGGTVRTAGQQIDLGAVTLTNASTIDTSNNGGSPAGAPINIASVTGGGNNLTVRSRTGATTVTGAVAGVGTLTLHDNVANSTGAMNFQGNLAATALVTVAQGYGVSLTGATTTVTNAAAFSNTGTVTLGDGGDTLTFTGGLTATAPSVVNVNGTVRAAGSASMSLGDGDTDVAVVGNSTIGGNSTGLVTLGGLVRVTSGRTLTLGNGAGTPFSTQGIQGTAASGNLTVNTTGAVTVNGAVGPNIGVVTVTNSGGTTFSGALAAGTVTLSNTTGTIAFQGNTTITTLNTAGAGYGVSFTGASSAITNAAAFNNTGTVTLGDGAGDVTLFNGGVSFPGNGPVNVAGAVRSSADAMDFGSGAVSLGADAILDSTNNGGNPTGANISVGAVSMGVYNLTINTGTWGGLVSGGKITGGNLRIRSGGSVAISTAVSAIEIEAGTGINVTEDDNVTIGFSGGFPPDVTGLTTAGGNLEFRSTGGSITVSENISAGGAGNITIGAGGGSLATDPGVTITAGTGDILLSADTMTLGGAVSGTGALSVKPVSAGRLVSLGAAGPQFDLTDTEIGYLADGFSSITLGDLFSGAVTVNTAVFRDPVEIQGGGTITVTAGSPSLSTSQDNAGISLRSAAGAGIVVNGGITAHGAGKVDILSGAGFTLGNGIGISSGSGNITIGTTGINSMLLDGTVSTAGAGTIAITGSRAVTMDADSLLETGSGAISVTSGAQMTLDVVESLNNGPITLTTTAGGIIEAADPSRIGALGSTSLLTIVSAGGVGASGTGALDTDVGTLVLSAAGDVYISEATALQLGSGAGPVTSSAGSITITAAGALTTGNDVTTTGGNGSVSLAGAGVTVGHDVTAQGTGTILIDGGGGNVDLSAGTLSTSSASAAAVVVRNAGNALLGDISASSGTVVLGQAGDMITGTVTQALATSVLAGVLTAETGGAIVLNRDNGVVSLGTVRRGGAFTLNNSPGGLTVTGPVTGGTITNDVTISAAGNLTVSGPVSTSGAGTTLSLSGQSVALGANLSAGGGTVRLHASADGISQTAGAITAGGLAVTGVGSGVNPFSLNQAGNHAAVFAAAVTGGDLSYTDAGAVSLGTVSGVVGVDTAAAGFSLKAGGAVSQTAAVAVGGTLNLDTGAFPITLNRNDNGFGLVTVVSAGTVTLRDADGFGIGAAAATGNFDASTVSGDITVSGTLSTGAGNILLHPAGDLWITGSLTATTGNITLDPADAAASLIHFNSLSSPTVATGGNVVFSDAVELGSDLEVTAGDVTVSSGIVSVLSGGVEITHSGVLTITDTAGAPDEAGSDINLMGPFTQINGGGTGTVMLQGDIVTNGGAAISLDGPVTLTGHVVLQANGGDISLAGAVDSDGTPRNLRLNASGTTTLGAPVGQAGPHLAELSTDAGGSTVISGGAVTTAGVQSFQDGVRLGADTILTGAGISFGSTLDSDGTARNLTVNDSGTTVFGGPVGTVSALAGLSTDAAGTTRISGGGVTTTGTQTYLDAVLLGADAVLDGTGILFSSTLNSFGANRDLTVTGAGATTFSQPVGGILALGDLSVAAGRTSAINGGGVTTTGAQSYLGPATLGTDTLLDSTDGGGSPAGADILFGGTLDSSGSNRNLTVTAGTGGDVGVAGVLGGALALGNLSVTGDNVALGGIGSGGSSGASGTVTVSAGGAVTLSGGQYRSGNSQTYSAPVGGVRLVLSADGGWDAGAGTLQLPGTTLYLDLPGWTVTLLSDLSAGRVVFYRGAWNLNGRTVTTAGDFVAFGSGYDPEDQDWTGPNTRFAYFPATAFSYYPGGGSYNGGTGAFSVGTGGSFSDLAGATVDVTGNFYVNGADMTGTAPWTLRIPDNSKSAPVFNGTAAATADMWGSPYAAAFNMTVSNSQVNSPDINGDGEGGWVAAASAGPPPEGGQGVTDGGGNTNWQFGRPEIVSVQTVRDNVIRITFTMPVENSNGEIDAAAPSVAAHNGARFFTAALVDDDDLPPFTALTTTSGEGNLSLFYLRTDTTTWSTDATGAGPGAAGSADYQGRNGGVWGTSTPNISFPKGLFRAARGKTMARNYGHNGFAAFTGTTDETPPALVKVEIGRAAHSTPASTSYDAHNFFDLHYSEPVNIGTDPDLAATAAGTPAAENLRAQDSFAAAGDRGGDLTGGGAAAVTVAGYFSYEDFHGVGPVERGSRDGNPVTNSLYRPEAHRLQIFLSGYDINNNPADPRWPGWHTGVADPGEATAITVPANPHIVDLAGNIFDHTETARLAADLFTPYSGGEAGLTAAAWDVDPPAFSPQSVDRYEIVSWDDDMPVNGLVDRFDFFIQDNASEIAGWDPDNDHPDTRPGPRGVRDSTLNYTGVASPPERLAFRIEQVDVVPLVNTFNQGFSSAAANPLFTVNTPDDPYFSLHIAENPDWEMIKELNISYNHTEAYITDLAGNLLPSTAAPMKIIDRAPPAILVSLASAGDDKIYVRFTEPVFGDNLAATQITGADFTLAGAGGKSVVGVTPLSTGIQPHSVREAFLLLDGALTADEAGSALVTVAAATNASIFDAAGNAMDPMSTRRISDVGLGVVTPLWASDGYNLDGRPFDLSSSSLRVFDGTGRLRPEDIILQARIETAGGVNLTLHYDADAPAACYGHNFPGVWLPFFIQGINPAPNGDARNVIPYDTAGQLRNFLIPETDPENAAGNRMDFVFDLDGFSCARLSDPADPRSLATWGFNFDTGKAQRGGVTIFNNVINPNRGERVLLSYTLKKPGMVNVRVFSLDGSLVRVLHRGNQGAEMHNLTWDGKNAGGRSVARGIYFIRVVGPDLDEIRKVMVVK